MLVATDGLAMVFVIALLFKTTTLLPICNKRMLPDAHASESTDLAALVKADRWLDATFLG